MALPWEPFLVLFSRSFYGTFRKNIDAAIREIYETLETGDIVKKPF